MAYQTGTATNATDLQTILFNFCTTNGWTNTSEVIHKGNSFNKITVVDAETLRIQGGLDSALTTPSSYTRQIKVRAASWPLTYHLFSHGTPNVIVLVVQFDVNWCQYMMFGEIVKANAGAYTGGNFFSASFNNDGQTVQQAALINDTQLAGTSYTGNSSTVHIPFVSKHNDNVANFTNVATGFYTDVDSIGWANHYPGGSSIYDIEVRLSDDSVKTLFRSPNTWNQQTVLVPIHLEVQMDSNLRGYLGYVEHIRYVRLDNYNVGDIIDLSPDKWKVFTFKYKDSSNRNGGIGAANTTDYYDTGVNRASYGTLGFAVRYDGP